MKLSKITNIGACGMAGFHIVCCGLPILSALVGIASPFGMLLPHNVMNIILIIAGALLALSWIIYFYTCGCNKKILILSSVLFAAAVSLHLFMPHAGEMTCH